jgi:hypothetical protein
MAKTVSESPYLPYPHSYQQLRDLASFDADLTKMLHGYLGDLARRANSAYMSDGSEPLTGGLQFPATPGTSTDPNNLDWYDERTWTPTLTFATPGDLAVTYAVQTGIATRIGRVRILSLQLLTSTFTHTTASGELRVSGVPTDYQVVLGTAQASIRHEGLNAMAGYSELSAIIIPGQIYMRFDATGFGVPLVILNNTHTTSGTNLRLQTVLVYT